MSIKKTDIFVILIVTLLIGLFIFISYSTALALKANNNNHRNIHLTNTTSLKNDKSQTYLINTNQTRLYYANSSNTYNTGIWHSAMVDETGNEQVNQYDIYNFEKNAGKKLALVVFSNNWYNDISFPTEMANIIKKNGAIPIIRMAPWHTNGPSLSNAGNYTVSNIANGQHDIKIKKWAEEAKIYNSSILVDFGYEPNIKYFPWSKQGPLAYIDAFRHIVNIFRQQNASNVYFVYHPDLSYNANNMKQWYPGDKFVDWILVSAYGEYEKNGTYSVLKESYNKLVEISASKPLGIEEWGIGSPTDTIETLKSLAQNKFPRIKIISVWNEGPESGKDRRIEQSPEMLNAYRNGIKNPVYLSSNFNPTPTQ